MKEINMYAVVTKNNKKEINILSTHVSKKIAEYHAYKSKKDCPDCEMYVVKASFHKV